MAQAFPYLVPGCKTFRTWHKWGNDRRKFRSQTSDNTDRWKSRGEQRQRRERAKRERIRRKVEKSRNTVFFQCFVLWIYIGHEVIDQIGQIPTSWKGNSQNWMVGKSKLGNQYIYIWVWINTYFIPFLGGWTSINPSYFDVNRRGTRFWHTAIY